MSLISPWGLSISFYSPSANLSPEIYSSAAMAGSWTSAWTSPPGGYSGYGGYGAYPLHRPGEYQPGWANRFFNNEAPTLQQSRDYDRDPAARAQKYVNSAYSQKWNQQSQKWEKASAYDAYSTTQHAARTENDLHNHTDGRDEEMMWLADSSKDWMYNDQKRMDYFHAVKEMGGSPYGKGVKAALANLIVPGSTGVTDDVGRALAGRLKASEMPVGEKTADALVNAYLAKLGGEAAVQHWLYPMLDAVHQQASARGGYDKPQSETDYTSNLRKKGLTAAEADVLVSTALAGKKDYASRKIVDQFPDLNNLPKVIGDDEKKRKRYEQLCVGGLKALGVEDSDQVSKYYSQIQQKIQKAAKSKKPVYDFAAFMKEAKALIDSGKAPDENGSARSGGRGRGHAASPSNFVPSQSAGGATPEPGQVPAAPAEGDGLASKMWNGLKSIFKF